MNALQKNLWLSQSKLRFLLTPPAKRVKLEIADDGRQLTFLLVSLHDLGYALHVIDSPVIFRELLCLRESTPIPFIIGGRGQRNCPIVISDLADVIDEAVNEGKRGILLDNDFFNSAKEGVRMPYFMHPSSYHAGYHKSPAPNPREERPVRLGFFGTRDADFYTRSFRFEMLNREEILESFFRIFRQLIADAKTPVSAWKKQQIVVSVDDKGGDHTSKSFLPQSEYFEALRSCDFFLSPPGWCMPLSHNIIEGMAAGAIPVINSSEYLHPKLEHGVNCLSFSTEEELTTAVEVALAMPPEKITAMHRNVIQYYDENLKPDRWLEKVIKSEVNTILINAEEVSLNTPTSHEVQ